MKNKILLLCLCTILCLSSCNELLFVESKENDEVCNHSWVTKVTDGSVLIDGDLVSVNSQCTVTSYCTKCEESHTEYKDPCIQLKYSEDGSVSIGSYSSGDIYIPSLAIIDGSSISINSIKGFYAPGVTAHQHIKALFLNESILSINSNCFKQCYRLQEITIPSNAVVGKNAFASCTGLGRLVFLDKVELDDCAFSSCTALKQVVSVKGIDVLKGNEDKFANCYLLFTD